MTPTFSHNELMAIYGVIRFHRDETNEELDEMEINDPDRQEFIEVNKVYNSILRKLNAVFKENGIEFKDL